MSQSASQQQVPITRLVQGWSAGDEQARRELSDQVYERLKQLAHRQLHGHGDGHTLQTTALVNEAFLKLNAASLDVESRRHFYALVARVMRQVLIDHARAAQRLKRGGERHRVTLSTARAAAPALDFDLLDLDRCLARLVQHHPRAAEMIELSYFGGYDQATVAELMQTSLSTVERELRFGRAWLRRQLEVGRDE